GVAVLEAGSLTVKKSLGKLAVLESKLGDDIPQTTVGIGHTRWATHGRPSDQNSHPHTDCTGKIAVVHNGIIENYLELREWLTEQGHTFKSETDTEVLPHLVEEFYQGDLEQAVQTVLAKVHGSYAMVVLHEDEPNKLIAARKDSPLVVGLGEGEYFIASDIPAILNYTRKTYILNDGEIAVLTRDGVKVTDSCGNIVPKEIFEVTWSAEAAEKDGYDHFMLKEIFEQPRGLKETINSHLAADNSHVILNEVGMTADEIKKIQKVFVVACGTAYHAGLVGKNVIEKLAKIPVEVDIASEFRYRDPLLTPETLVVVVSQSGETADTLAALREAKKQGCRVLAVTNVVGSSVSRDADGVIYTWAGPEIAVASTKAYTTQLAAMYLLAIHLGKVRETIAPDYVAQLIAELRKVPGQVENILQQAPELEEMAKMFVDVEDTFFIGRGLDYSVALEGSLKLKEISYIHAEAYAAGELKHGTLALIEENVPVIALATQEDLFEKTLSNIQEVKARDAKVFGIAFEGHTDIKKSADFVFYIPRIHQFLSPLLSVVPLQLLSYYVSVARGCDVDKPRNLAKSVTVE
ncbi:MAG TPA: glutamine--fructose-6-phosphate transaminase (isomerizing), partial [Verrucomicrobiae bacterium]|nr:glutamine--fructose-6-phosphate transaminase (isomerizing) [Verrucomicrobiae bacterium]